MESHEDQQDEARISAELAQRIGRGDRSAEAELFERYGRGVLYLLNRKTRDPELARDLRQETFRVAIEHTQHAALLQPPRHTLQRRRHRFAWGHHDLVDL